MTLLPDDLLFKLPVYTKSGTHLGRLVGFEFDADRQEIARYRVRPKGLAAQMLKSPLLVARSQVLEITDEKMTVDDNVEKAVDLEKAKAIGLVNTTEA